MMNDTTKESNGKNTYTNKVCHTLRFGGSWNLVTLNSRVGEYGGGRGGVTEKKNKNKNFWVVVLLGTYFLGRRCPIGHGPIGHPLKLEMEDSKNFHMP